MNISKNSNVYINHEWIHFSYRFIAWLILGILLLLGVMVWMGWQLLQQQLPVAIDLPMAIEWQESIQSHSQQLRALETQTRQHIDLITQHIGRIEANLIRINALGERMVQTLKLDPREFNFNEQPHFANKDFPGKEKDPILLSFKELEATLEKRYSQLASIHQIVQTQAGHADMALKGSGNPVIGGYVSSFFGHRKDPIHGGKAWHAGVDIAGREGAEIKALAGGIVSFAAVKGGYGRLVEINHGNGLITRYAHNKTVLVKKGQLVHKGDTIALVGNSGRSTGPHVHLEIQKDGEVVDPGRYFPDLSRG